MSDCIDAVMIGAGNRGHRAYGRYAAEHLRDQLRFVAVAEPRDDRRERFADLHGIPPSGRFRSWEELSRKGRLARAAINTTMDRTTWSAPRPCSSRGTTSCSRSRWRPGPRTVSTWCGWRTKRGAGSSSATKCATRHYFSRVREIVASGVLGDLVSIDWRENLSFRHFAHSYIRGNWGNSGRSAPMILAKCSHDLDFLVLLIGRRPERVASFGSLTHFTAERALADMPARCTDGCPHSDTCLWYAPRVYISPDTPEFMLDPVSIDHSPEAMLEGLRTGPYGRCVYRCDNDVVDHQVVALDFGQGLAISMTMQGSSHVEGRTLRIDGMRATLLGDQSTGRLLIHDHLTGETETIHPSGRRYRPVQRPWGR